MRRVLITGAAGNLGAKLRRALEHRSDYDLVLLDKRAVGDSSIVEADLSRYDAAWTNRLAGVDTVVHLAADGWEYAEWASLVRNNVDALLNVFDAAATHRVRRVVFASSVQAMRGHTRKPAQRITTSLETLPVNFYGATKVFGERLARSYSERHGLSVVCLRIGWTPPDNSPERIVRGDPDVQRVWLSDRDFCGYVERAIIVPDAQFAIVNATSSVTGSMWDLDEGAKLLGYAPQDRWNPPAPTVAANVKRALTNLIRRAAWRLAR